MSADEGGEEGDAPAEPEDGRQAGTLDATMRSVIRWVAGSAAVMTAIALLVYGARAALGVAMGGAIATANLYVFARIVDAFLSRRGHTVSWTVIAMIKLVALLGGVWFILKSDVVSGLSLTIGYVSLVIGITLGTLFGPKPPDDAADKPASSG